MFLFSKRLRALLLALAIALSALPFALAEDTVPDPGAPSSAAVEPSAEPGGADASGAGTDTAPGGGTGTETPSESGASGEDGAGASEDLALTITNTTSMFKAVSASLVKENGREVLVVALSGKTYQKFFPGTYAEAVDNGDNRKAWIEGTLNADGKWEFRLPVKGGASVVPAVSISETYLASYESGENDLERAFYPRQFVIDRAAAALTVGDYRDTIEMRVRNHAAALSVKARAETEVIGGPNSNNYCVAPTLEMKDAAWDAVLYPTVENGELTTATAELSGEKTFEIRMINMPKVAAFHDGEPVELQFKNAESGEWVTFTLTIDLLGETIELNGTEGASDEGGSSGSGSGGSSSARSSHAEAEEVPEAAEPKAPVFADVPAGAYYEEAVKYCVEKGITTGKTADRFAPDETCTRAQIVTFLYRAAGSPKPTNEIAFTDVARDAYYYDAVRWAAAAGITKGLLPDRFCPDVPCSRGEAVVFLHRAAGAPKAGGSCPFVDVPAWCAEAAAWAAEKGIANGFSADRFNPSATVKRAQIAAFLWRASGK